LKWSPERTARALRDGNFVDVRLRRRGLLVAAGIAAALGSASLCAYGSLVVWQSPGLLLGAGNSISRWLENAESGSGVEKALYRLMKLPGGEALYRRSKPDPN